MIKYYFLFAIIVTIISPVVSQDYDQNYFRSPVDHGMRLSGSFAELRTNHFHMGIDIKSARGRSGDPIYAVADGIVSRINVDASGYGNAIYIDHNNGYTTVYAHLSSFSDTLANHITKEQYKRKTFQLQLYPDSLFIVKKGDLIGRMGNTGKSFGPHLHFEIRETKTESPVNPFLFGLKPTDNRPPVFQAIRFYKIDSTGTSLITEKKVENLSRGKYVLDENLINVPTQQIGISVQVYDQMDGAYNKNGVYRMKVLADNKVIHGYKLDRVSYDESHFINSFIDYEEKQKSKRQFSNCFRNPVDQLSIYEHQSGREGKIILKKDTSSEVKVVLQDFHGNESELNFNIQYSPKIYMGVKNKGNYELALKDKNIIRLEHAEIIFDAESFVNNYNIQISEGSELIDGVSYPFFKIGNENVPLFKPYSLHIKGLAVPDSLKPHFTIVKCKSDKDVAYQGEWNDSIYTIELTELGTYQCMTDKIPPKITSINLKSEMVNQNKLKLKITDNLQPGSKKLRLKYHGQIDGQWVLFNYDLKNDLIYYNFDESLPPGEHKLKLTVNDHRGNIGLLSYQFTNF